MRESDETCTLRSRTYLVKAGLVWNRWSIMIRELAITDFPSIQKKAPQAQVWDVRDAMSARVWVVLLSLMK